MTGSPIPPPKKKIKVIKKEDWHLKDDCLALSYQGHSLRQLNPNPTFTFQCSAVPSRQEVKLY